MQQEFREGDWVRHPSYPEQLRVVGLGPTIAVRFPNGSMRAFEPCELEKVVVARAPVRKAQVHEHRQDRGGGSAGWLGLITSFSLMCLIALVLLLIAGAGR